MGDVQTSAKAPREGPGREAAERELRRMEFGERLDVVRLVLMAVAVLGALAATVEWLMEGRAEWIR